MLVVDAHAKQSVPVLPCFLQCSDQELCLGAQGSNINGLVTHGIRQDQHAQDGTDSTEDTTVVSTPAPTARQMLAVSTEPPQASASLPPVTAALPCCHSCSTATAALRVTAALCLDRVMLHDAPAPALGALPLRAWAA